MTREEIQNGIRACLKRSGLNQYSAAVSAGLPEDAIRTVLFASDDRASRLSDICEALELEFYIGPPRDERDLKLPDSTDSYVWGDRRGQEVTPYEVRMHEGHKPERVDFSPNGCASFGLDFLLNHDLNPKMCEVVEFRDNSMVPEFPTGAAGLVDLRKTKRFDG